MKIRVKPKMIDDDDYVIEEKDYYTPHEMDIMYRRVRDYLYEHQGENAIVVSENTHVPRDIIMTFLRQGKISIVENSKSLLKSCKSCGAFIETGDMCVECLQKRMSKILNPEQEKTSKRKISGYSSNKNLGNQETSYGRRIRKK